MLVLTLPAFQVRQVTVVGARLVTTSAVVAAAEVPEESIFTINGAAIQGRVLALPWVASAVVTTQLPATVSIAIVERAPVLRIRRDGADTLVAANGATLPGIDATPPRAVASRCSSMTGRARPAAQSAAGPGVELDLAAFSGGLRLLGRRLSLGSGRRGSIWTSTGWRAVLGPLDTEDPSSCCRSRSRRWPRSRAASTSLIRHSATSTSSRLATR